jgi:hypothetical protein
VATILQVVATNTTTGNANVVFDLDVGRNANIGGNMIVVGDFSTTQNLNVNGVTNLNGLTFFNKNYAEKHNYVEITANTATINLSEASAFTINLSSDITTLNVTSMPSTTHVVAFTLFIKIGVNPYSIVWPDSFRWQTSTEPILSIAENDVDIFTFLTYDGGTNWFAVIAGQGF